MTTFTLRDYQTRAVEEINSHWASGISKVILSLPTGGGKTETALSLIEQETEKGNHCLVVVERIVLARQWAARMKRHGLGDPGILQGGKTKNTNARVLIATAQSIASRGITVDRFSLVIIDECQYWHGAHKRVLSALKKRTNVLGLSATPFNRTMLETFEAVVAPVSVATLVQDGMLVPPRYFVPDSGMSLQDSLKTVPVVAGDYKGEELEKVVSDRAIVGDVVATWFKHGQNRQTIAFCVSKAHAKAVAAEFVSAGVTAVSIDADTPANEREVLIDKFERGEIRILTSINVLAVGFDSPVASCAIMARPTQSRGLSVQMDGRVIRNFSGKKDAVILDHAANVLRFGSIKNFSIEKSIAALYRSSHPTNNCRIENDYTPLRCACGYVMLDGEHSCPECGERRKVREMRYVDGELVEVVFAAGTTPEGYSEEDVEEASRIYKTCTNVVGRFLYYGQYIKARKYVRSIYGDGIIRHLPKHEHVGYLMPKTTEECDAIYNFFGIEDCKAYSNGDSAFDYTQVARVTSRRTIKASRNAVESNPKRAVAALIMGAVWHVQRGEELTKHRMFGNRSGNWFLESEVENLEKQGYIRYVKTGGKKFAMVNEEKFDNRETLDMHVPIFTKNDYMSERMRRGLYNEAKRAVDLLRSECFNCVLIPCVFDVPAAKCLDLSEPSKPAGKKWTDEAIIADARKYKTSAEWAKASPSAYQLARRYGIFAKACEHMERVYKKSSTRTGMWSRRECIYSARSYANRADWKIGEPAAYEAARINGWVNDCARVIRRRRA